MKVLRVVLTIAGYDPSAGAGVLADVKAIEATGCYAVAVVTSITFQNTRGVFGAEHLDVSSIRAQADALLDDFEIAAIKTGMLPTPEIVGLAAEIAGRLPGVPLVVDPVMRSTSGASLADSDAVRSLSDTLIPHATVVTPNVVEASRLANHEILTIADMEDAGRRIRESGTSSVLVTGGDLEIEESGRAVDVLVDDRGATRVEGERIESGNTHGTGCTLASAIAARLALGDSVFEAVRYAKGYVTEAIRSAPGLGSGHGPIDHFWAHRR